MKQRDLIKKLQDAGFVLYRHGGNHDIYRRGTEEEQKRNRSRGTRR